MKPKNRNHIIVDCSGVVYAAFYAFGPVLTYNNRPTGVIYGFLSKILKLATKFKTNKFYFCWDHPVNYRKKIYPPYKENRHEDLTTTEKKEYELKVDQEIELRDFVLRGMGFMNHFYQRGFESDDLMAVVANRLNEYGYKVLMVTADNDMYQCLEDCDIINPKTFSRLTMDKFIKVYRVLPSQWAFCKAIGGCTGDNVKGIVGCGDPKGLEKGSKTITMKYVRGELTKGKTFDRITSKEGGKIIKRNLNLVTLPYMPDRIKEPFIRRNKYERIKFIQIFDKYRFRSFLDKKNFIKWEEVFLCHGEK